ncbi:alpha-galactosidase [Catenulispora sp. EB89]|uniref:glycoside hydrolase family 27 protein n=1 Tax=Catenulispora sp. EB89 TaxID=3156257 RepID=UPI003518DDAD
MLAYTKIRALMMVGVMVASSAAGFPVNRGQGDLLAPPMGWSSWSSLREHISASIIEAQADAMHASLQRYGYQYVNIDAGWFSGVDEYGRQTWDPTRFPGGISAVAAYVHRLGLKLGIYLTPGIPAEAVAANSPILGTPYHISDIADTSVPGNTAGQGAARIDFSKPGAAAYVQSQADLLASWGVDYLKMDFVGPGGGRVQADDRPDMAAWHAAIAKTGRPLHLELSNSLNFADAATWARDSNGWRIESDIECYSRCPGQLTNWGQVLKRFTDAPKWVPFAGPGHWNDLDSLEVGGGTLDGLTADEKQTMATLWSIESAPLLLGVDLTKLDPADLPLITNRDVIAVDQAGRPAHPVSQATPQQVWFTRNAGRGGHDFTVALFNLGDTASSVTANWSDLGLPAGSAAMVRDLWQHTNIGRKIGGFTATLAPHASMLLDVRGVG